MTRRSWDELPADVRRAIEIRCGGVDAIVDAPTGSACDFAGTLVTPATALFCKVVHRSGRPSWMLRNELRINSWLPSGAAPRVLWDLAAGDWLIVAFEHVEGRHADLSPGSADLDAVAAAVDRLSSCTVSDWTVPVQPIENRWRATGELRGVELGDVDLYAGYTLAHTDLAASNLLVAPDCSITVVDWGWPAQGAPWLDAALLVVHLVRHGHHPAAAEDWAATTVAWPSADPDRLDAFAATLCALRSHQAETHPAPHRLPAATAAKTWMTYRRSARTTGRRRYL